MADTELRRAGTRSPWQEFFVAETDDADAHARLALFVEGLWCAEPHEISLFHLLFYMASAGGYDQLMDTGGGAQERRFCGGAAAPVLAVADLLGERVRLGERVLGVDYSDRGVTVRTATAVILARRAIITVPPAALEAIEFSPALPSSRRGWVAGTAMGKVAKIHAFYPTPFWRADGLAGIATLYDAGPLGVIFDNSPADGACGVLVGFVYGDRVECWAALDADARRSAALGSLASVVGARALTPIDYTEKNWADGSVCPRRVRGIRSPRCMDRSRPLRVAWTHRQPALGRNRNREPMERLHGRRHLSGLPGSRRAGGQAFETGLDARCTMTVISTRGVHLDDDLAQRVRLVVLSSGMSQREFADGIGMDPTALSKALAGTRRLRDDEVASIAALGKVSQRYLRHGTGRPPALNSATDVDQIVSRSEPVDPTVRRAQILDSTARLIARRGLHNVRVADIARACGTSTGTIHNYFPTKEDALRAALDHYADRLVQRLEGEFELATDNVDKLRRLVEVQLIITDQDADEWSIWVQSWNEAILRPDFREFQQRMYGRWRRTVVDTIRACQRDGIGTSGDAETLTSRFTGMVDGLAIQVLAGSAAMSTTGMRELLLDAFEPHIRLRVP